MFAITFNTTFNTTASAALFPLTAGERQHD